MKRKLCFLLLLCPFFWGFGQEKNISYANNVIKIGDRMPDMIIWPVINYSSKSLRISDFKGKLVILDFWATWCTSCLAHFPIADSLQREFKNDLQILLVDALNTRDTREKALNTVQKFD